jgi:DnaK suppressor protein
MDKESMDEIKQKLLTDKENIISQLKSVTRETSFDKDKVQTKWQNLGSKDEDNAVEVADFQDNISLEKNLEISLEKIEKSLKRLEDGTYGQCEKCGQAIEEARLKAYPEASVCLNCTAK